MNITAVLMTHREGRLIRKSLQSFNEAIEYARRLGLTVEGIITSDNPDKETMNELSALDIRKYQLINLSYGDMGKVRNHVAEIASGEYFAFLDGDDLWSYNWLYSAYSKSENELNNVIVHPEFNWLFGETNNIFVHSDTSDSYFDDECLRSTNPWDSICFCKTSTVKQYPYLKRQIKEGFAYEDWNWNRRTLEAGITHVVVRDTIIFKRRRSTSQGAIAAKRGVIAMPSKMSYYKNY